MTSDAALKVCAIFAKEWSDLSPSKRGEFYNDVQLFMRFYTESSNWYRDTLHRELTNPRPEGEIVNPHVQEHVHDFSKRGPPGIINRWMCDCGDWKTV
jgi:hypothetical protein